MKYLLDIVEHIGSIEEARNPYADRLYGAPTVFKAFLDRYNHNIGKGFSTSDSVLASGVGALANILTLLILAYNPTVEKNVSGIGMLSSFVYSKLKNKLIGMKPEEVNKFIKDALVYIKRISKMERVMQDNLYSLFNIDILHDIMTEFL